MSNNPYAAFQTNDDSDEEGAYIKPEEKHKRTHQQRKNFKKQQEVTTTAPKAPAVSQPEADLPQKLKEKKLYIRKDREQRPKELGQGHTLDRQSGTGRNDRPRKEGGGRGNLGNQKDLQHPEKYLKEGEEVPATEEQVEKKPEQPQGITLQEYYRTKGVDITYNAEKKTAPQKGQINAEWIKKEKLTVLQTKEDKKNQERSAVQTKQTSKVVEQRDPSTVEMLGFGSKPLPARKQAPVYDKKGGKKAVINESDFPTL